jgi:O-acetylhomoserine (thiol)-lyase
MTMFADILPTFGITTRFVDSQDPNNFAAQIDENTRCIFVETCANPSLQVADLDAISKVAQAHGLPLVVDATFSTPYLTRPFEHGADVIVHSLTKWLGGHGTTLGGIVIDKGTFE